MSVNGFQLETTRLRSPSSLVPALQSSQGLEKTMAEKTISSIGINYWEISRSVAENLEKYQHKPPISHLSLMLLRNWTILFKA